MATTRNNIVISLSLVGLTIFIFCIGFWLGFVPDENKFQVAARVKFSEALAVHFSVAAQHENLKIIPAVIKSVVERNTDIQSILVRKTDGSVIAGYGDHPQQDVDSQSTSNLIKVPIFKDNEKWAIVEINYVPLESSGWQGFIRSAFFKMIIFIALFGFIVYLLLVRRVLRELDPYRVIPGRVNKALNAISEGIVLIDSEDSIVLANKAFGNRLNINANELTGKKLSDFAWSFPDRSSEKKKILPWRESILDGNNHDHVTLNHKTAEGNSITLIANTTPLQDAKGKTRGVLASFSDVTEFEKMNRGLEGMAQFLRHEMRNALVGATSTISLLEQSAHLTEDDKELLGHAHQSHRLISLLLESAQEAKSIESTFENEKPGPLRIDALISKTVAGYSDVYSDNSFEFHSDENALVVLGQEERILQLLDKLTGNAIDHSDTGTPIVYSCCKENDRAVIKVANQGKSLPEDKHGIFDLFASYRTETATKHNQGIGLYVVRLIVETYGGTVEARDRKDVTGAEFIIRLPIV
jgi:PAS domain S-box-containing protein